MGLFSRRPKFRLPPWTFHPVDGERITLGLSLGGWRATDGGHLRDSTSIKIGDVVAHEASLDLRRGPDGLQSLTLLYKTAVAILERTAEIVVDSGHAVLCSEDEFLRAGIIDRDRAVQLLRASRDACPNSDVMLIREAGGYGVGIIAIPPLGDGAYLLRYESADNWRSLRVELEEST